MAEPPVPDEPDAGDSRFQSSRPTPLQPPQDLSDAPPDDSPDVSRYCLRCRAPLQRPARGETRRPRCPRCDWPYDPFDRRTYADRPGLPRWLWALTGFVAAVFFGTVAYSLFVLFSDPDMGADAGVVVLGYAAFFCVPFAVGALLGYLTRPSIWLALLLSLFAILCITSLLCSMKMSGLFCGAVLGGLFLGPAFLGVLAGAGLRLLFPRAAWDRRRWYVALLLAGSPLAAGLIEGQLPRRPDVREVSTALVFRATPQQAWDGILFYEQVDHPPPWLLTLALPRPVRAEGSKEAVGDVQRCVYENGHLVKRVTRRVEQQELAFEVLEQRLHFERDVTLRDGAFRLEPLADGRTRVVLTTRYVRHLSPAWLWEPMERKILHTLHGHVLEGMRRRCAAGLDDEEPTPWEARPAEVAAVRE